MVKIKQKKQLNLPQLIEWGFENDVTNKEYVCNEHKAKSVIFNLSGWTEFSDEFSYNPHDTFTVEVEEEVTDDTLLDLVARFTDENGAYYTTPKRMSINTCLEAELDDVTCTHFYIENDDRELVLIWRDGRLIE